MVTELDSRHSLQPDESSGLARQDIDHLIEIIHMVNRHCDEETLIQHVLDRLMQIGVSSFVVARRLSNDKSLMVPVAQLNPTTNDALVDTLANLTVPAEGTFEGYALAHREPLVVNGEVGTPDVELAPDYLDTVMFVAQRGATGGYFFPMVGADEIGVITFYADDQAEFDTKRQKLVASAVRVLSFGIDKCRMLRTFDDQQLALAATRDRLAASNRDLQDFAYVASHDLQEPLRKIQAFGDRLENLAADRLDDQQLLNLEKMQSSSSKMQSLIQDLLRFSRINTCDLEVGPVLVTELVHEATMTTQGALERAGATIEILGEPCIDVDRKLGVQLFANLIGNALKYRSPDRPLHLIIGAEGTDRSTTVRVSDNGIGFEQSYEKRIFDPFFRLHNDSEISGSGIGLALCRRITERHDGSIEATGSEGVGATFSLSFPRVSSDDSESSVQPKKPAVLAKSTTSATTKDSHE